MPDTSEVIDEPALVVYYCRDCQKIVKGESKGKTSKYSFLCPECKNPCVYGTAKSLINFYRLKESSENGQILLQMQKEKLEQKKQS